MAISQRRALGALFLLLALLFAGIAVAGFMGGTWVAWAAGFAAAILSLWLATLSLAALWRRAR